MFNALLINLAKMLSRSPSSLNATCPTASSVPGVEFVVNASPHLFSPIINVCPPTIMIISLSQKFNPNRSRATVKKQWMFMWSWMSC
jgi:hypothetical protein